ncbi:hypothetical protein MUCCIDRAFT_105036 [Mucor lusitanicus CBS 277.49]|uniref:Uncharacterized protein n=1 Tax=Mucor lusitanicus CBS 277.49 TaxID=747725 RepID=A0A168PQX9_MUCCL|nr:hypothetical protein MUCCIDRAFT_105036 [Mucor lusitanicus CBS 277.49]
MKKFHSDPFFWEKLESVQVKLQLGMTEETKEVYRKIMEESKNNKGRFDKKKLIGRPTLILGELSANQLSANQTLKT